MVRCKFKCISKKINGSGENRTNSFEFNPVIDGSEENKKFWKWTPSGKFEFQCLNPNVDFEIDKDYYINIELAE